MSRTKSFPVVHNRVQFKCPNCKTRSYLSVPPSVRRRSIRCKKCNEVTNCQLNRRTQPRDSQSGACVLVKPDGQEIDITLHDISI